MRRVMITGTCVLVAALAAVAVAGGDMDDAKRKVAAFDKEYEALRKLTPEETRKIVTAVCEAEEAERKDVSKEAGRRAKDAIAGKYKDLEKRKDEAIKALDAVLADKALQSKHSEATRHKKDVLARWDSVDRMSRSLRGANHPVVAYMLEQGQSAHSDYQDDCDVSEFPVAGGKADCIKASTCEVIELKPDNTKAIKEGASQVQRYADALSKKGDAYEVLVKKNSKFAKCAKFNVRVACYRLCPVINDKGEFEEARPTWREKCQ